MNKANPLYSRRDLITINLQYNTPKKIFKKPLPKLTLSLGQSLSALALLSIISLIMQAVMQTELLSYIKSPLLIIFNCLPVFFLMLVLFLMTGRLWAGYIPVNLVYFVMLMVNHYKISFLDEPFKPIDIILATEALNISQNYTIIPHISVILGLLIFILTSVFLVKCVKTEKGKWKMRLVFVLPAVLLSVGAYVSVYKNTSIYAKVYTPTNEFNDVVVIREKGFLYSFLNNMNSMIYEKPDGYSIENAESIISQYENNVATPANADVSGKKPINVISIMSEAFFDPQLAENISFHTNPLEKYNELKKESIYGNIIVPGFAGSTASSEFEFLTGINISLIDKSMPVVYKTHIIEDVYGLPRYFKDLGYSTSAIHPGHNWFYNRQNVYRRMGFDTTLFMEDFDFTPEMVNYYTADSVTSQLIIDDYKKHLEENPDKGYYNFTVTIQNHGPYVSSNPGDEELLVRPDNISDSLYNTLNNYMLGLRDAAELLVSVKEYTETIDAPTVIVFFGDHLPYFDSELKGYEAIGYDVTEGSTENIKRRYSTPYIICSNKAAKDIISQKGEVLTGDRGEISSNYLANEMFDYMGIEPSGFFGFAKQAREQVNILSPSFMMNAGNLIEEENVSEWLKNYRIMQYYNLRDFSN